MKRFSPEFTIKLRRRAEDIRLLSAEALAEVGVRCDAQGSLWTPPPGFVSLDCELAFRVYQGTMFKDF